MFQEKSQELIRNTIYKMNHLVEKLQSQGKGILYKGKDILGKFKK